MSVTMGRSNGRKNTKVSSGKIYTVFPTAKNLDDTVFPSAKKKYSMFLLILGCSYFCHGPDVSRVMAMGPPIHKITDHLTNRQEQTCLHHKCLLIVSCSVCVVVIQHTMSTNLTLLYTMFGLAGTEG